jgi:hypothetical protein
MGQEFIIKSNKLEDKINQLLPSQGGFQAGVDLSASTTIIPIVDLTESAEGSNLRADLQTALSFITATSFSVVNTTTTLVNTTGYYRVFGTLTFRTGTTGTGLGEFIINDGTTDKTVWSYQQSTTSTVTAADNCAFDFIIFLTAGDSLIAKSQNALLFLQGSTRQVADISGNLISP